MGKKLGNPSAKKITELEFAAVQPFWDTSAERKQAAYAVLIEGETLQAAADRIGCSRQNVSKVVSDFMSILSKYYESQSIVSEIRAKQKQQPSSLSTTNV